MHVAIVGAGAMGTLLGHGFSGGGHQVSLIDLPSRISQLESVGGLVVADPNGARSAAIPSLLTSDFSEVVAPDVVFLATKSQDLPAIAESVDRISGKDTIIVTIQNGIPWWYLHSLVHDFGDVRINCLDPDGMLERHVNPAQIVGCVAYPAAMLEADGSVRHVEGVRFPVGEIEGSARKRTHKIAGLFESGGFKSRVIDDIRSEIWLKAWGALSINPVSALSRATMVEICSFDETRELIAKMMLEAQGVAEAFGASFRHTIERRIEGARAVGAHKTSMLQDVERGSPLELDGLMLAVLELAEIAGKKAPLIESIYACTALLNNSQLMPRFVADKAPLD